MVWVETDLVIVNGQRLINGFSELLYIVELLPAFLERRPLIGILLLAECDAWQECILHPNFVAGRHWSIYGCPILVFNLTILRAS